MLELLVPYFGIYSEYVAALIVVVVSLMAAKVINFIIRRAIFHVTSKTKTTLDDLMIHAIGRPIFLGVLLVGIQFALGTLSATRAYVTEIGTVFTVI